MFKKQYFKLNHSYNIEKMIFVPSGTPWICNEINSLKQIGLTAFHYEIINRLEVLFLNKEGMNKMIPMRDGLEENVSNIKTER